MRCAETTRTSCAMPRSVSVAAACCRVSQSERDPITRPTRGRSWAGSLMEGLRQNRYCTRKAAFARRSRPPAILTARPRNAMIDRRLLDILCDPVTKSPVRLLSSGELEALNRAIAAGQVRTEAGAPLDDRRSGRADHARWPHDLPHRGRHPGHAGRRGDRDLPDRRLSEGLTAARPPASNRSSGAPTRPSVTEITSP